MVAPDGHGGFSVVFHSVSDGDWNENFVRGTLSPVERRAEHFIRFIEEWMWGFWEAEIGERRWGGRRERLHVEWYRLGE